jgi:hypothetical protein
VRIYGCRASRKRLNPPEPFAYLMVLPLFVIDLAAVKRLDGRYRDLGPTRLVSDSANAGVRRDRFRGAVLEWLLASSETTECFVGVAPTVVREG